MRAMGRAMKESGVAREEIFLVGKIGSGLPMGADEVHQQITASLQQYQTDYMYCAR